MYKLKVENLRFKYDEKIVLNNISFEVKKGEFLTIIGPNGSGKSTLLKVLNNTYTPLGGNIYINNNNIKNLKRKELARKMAMVFQDNNINYEFTAEDIVLMGRYPHKKRFEKDNKEDYNIVKESLEMTNTTYLKNKMITQLSGGERQRIVIAKALAQRAEIILLDEPTSNLDINHQIEILELLKTMNKENGTTIVLVMHDINLGIRYSDQIMILKNGKIVEKGKPEEIITKENIESTYDIKVAIEKSFHTDSLYITPLGL